jgi:protein-histidine pros-kinase
VDPALKILLVEDNEINRLLAKKMLGHAGHQVTIAENGQKALDRLLEQPFDLVFMDIQMPEMDGLEATATIRANPAWRHLPVIAMTAHAMTGDRERFLAAGMDDYISKPIHIDEVKAAITRQIERAAAQKTQNGASPVNGNGNGNQRLIIDKDAAQQRMGLNEADYAEILQLFVTNLDHRVIEIERAAHQEDFGLLKNLTHSLKGVAANLGVEQISHIAEQLEFASRNNEQAGITLLLHQLHSNVADFKQLALVE